MKTEREKQQLLRQKQEKKILSAKKPKQVLAVFEKSEFEPIRVKAIDRLDRMIKDGDPKALDAMKALSVQAPHLADRCEAALRLPDRNAASQAMNQAFQAGLANGKLEKLGSYNPNYHYPLWFELVRDDRVLMGLLYDRGGSNVRRQVVNNATDKALLWRILLESDDLGYGDLESISKRFSFTQDDFAELVQKARSEWVVSSAIEHLDLQKRSLLEKLADGGNTKAKYRLLQLSPEYASRYVSYLSGSQLDNALRKKSLNQQALETLCIEYYPAKKKAVLSSFTLSRMLDALSQLTDPARLAHVLEVKRTQVKTYISDKDYETWMIALLERFASSQDLLAEFLLSSTDRAIYYPIEEHALELLTDQDVLFKVASGRCYMAKEAAEKLPVEKLQILVKNSKDPNVREYADRQLRMARASTTESEKELLDTFAWSIEQARSKEIGLTAIRRVQSQENLLKALSVCGNETRSDVCELRQEILPRITDWECLMKLIQEDTDNVHYTVPRRLYELIAGTPREQEFIDWCVRCYRKSGMTGHYMWLLSKFLDSSELHLIWRYCGEQKILRMLHDMERAEEYDTAATIANNIKTFYRNIPESVPLIEPYRGMRYTKHADFDATCASESRHENVNFTFQI